MTAVNPRTVSGFGLKKEDKKAPNGDNNPKVTKQNTKVRLEYLDMESTLVKAKAAGALCKYNTKQQVVVCTFMMMHALMYLRIDTQRNTLQESMDSKSDHQAG